MLICAKIGITNHDEYSLVWDKPEDEQENVALFVEMHQTTWPIAVSSLVVESTRSAAG